MAKRKPAPEPPPSPVASPATAGPTVPILSLKGAGMERLVHRAGPAEPDHEGRIDRQINGRACRADRIQATTRTITEY